MPKTNIQKHVTKQKGKKEGGELWFGLPHGVKVHRE